MLLPMNERRTEPTSAPAAVTPAAVTPAAVTPWVALATFFGAGRSPIAPGTVGSAASFVLWGPVVLLDAPLWARGLLVALVFALGIPACSRAVHAFGREDPKQAVIDEVAGQGLALLVAPAQPMQLLVCFLLFRLFDVWKPWPISVIDRRVHGGLGIMLDDMVAGLFALGVALVLDVWVWPHTSLAPLLLGAAP